MNKQHAIYIRALGYLLHPTITNSLTTATTQVQIADVGTGTRVWLRDVQRDLLPQGVYHGFDISPQQFPVGDEVKGMQFHLQDFLEPFPERFVGKFDVVHLRMTATSMTAGQWGDTARQVVRLLSEFLRLPYGTSEGEGKWVRD